ncbi:MAG: Iron-containing redox enzyme [Frankiales bacterium]|nr:Iron-containing redox enzyme [Frankiales bacterium]
MTVAALQALPTARGPVSEAVLEALTGGRLTTSLPVPADPFGEDLQLALHLLYELHYRALPGVDDDLEWDPDLLRLRARLEAPFLAALRAATSGSDDVEAALAPLLLEPVRGTGPSWHLSSEAGTLEQLREYATHRSVYHLREADPQAFVVGRLEGQAKAAVVTVQHDEYGAGRVERMHATLFADLLAELGVDDVPLDRAPATTIALTNAMSLFALHRSLRGAAFGQFVLVEVTSSPGSRRLSAAFARHGVQAGVRFYDEHVEADAVHEQLLRAGLRDLLEREPHLAADVVLGIEAGLLLEERFGAALLDAWERGDSSLRQHS